MVRNGGGRALPELKARFSAPVRVLNKAHLNKAHLSPGGAGRIMRCSGTGGREPHPVRSNGGMASSQAGVSRSKCRVLGGALGGGRSGRRALRSIPKLEVAQDSFDDGNATCS